MKIEFSQRSQKWMKVISLFLVFGMPPLFCFAVDFFVRYVHVGGELGSPLPSVLILIGMSSAFILGLWYCWHYLGWFNGLKPSCEEGAWRRIWFVMISAVPISLAPVSALSTFTRVIPNDFIGFGLWFLLFALVVYCCIRRIRKTNKVRFVFVLLAIAITILGLCFARTVTRGDSEEYHEWIRW